MLQQMNNSYHYNLYKTQRCERTNRTSRSFQFLKAEIELFLFQKYQSYESCIYIYIFLTLTTANVYII